MPRKIVILGAGGTAMQVADSILATPDGQLAGFLDDFRKEVEGYEAWPVLGPLAGWSGLPGDWLFANSLYGAKRNRFFHDLVMRLGIPAERWATVVDPGAEVSRSAQVGPGCYLGRGASLHARVRVGALGCLLGNNYLGHDGRLEEYVCCAHGASLAGGASVGRGGYLGMNCCLREGVRVGRFAVVGMGGVVVRDVGDELVVAGNPARPLRSGR